MLHEETVFTCPHTYANDGCHFEGRCEDCDVRIMSRLNLEQIMDRFGDGRVTRDQYDAYRWMWAYLSPHGSHPHWCSQPYVTDPNVQRIARKLLIIREYPVSTWPALLAEGYTE